MPTPTTETYAEIRAALTPAIEAITQIWDAFVDRWRTIWPMVAEIAVGYYGETYAVQHLGITEADLRSITVDGDSMIVPAVERTPTRMPNY